MTSAYIRVVHTLTRLRHSFLVQGRLLFILTLACILMSLVPHDLTRMPIRSLLLRSGHDHVMCTDQCTAVGCTCKRSRLRSRSKATKLTCTAWKLFSGTCCFLSAIRLTCFHAFGDDQGLQVAKSATKKAWRVSYVLHSSVWFTSCAQITRKMPSTELSCRCWMQGTPTHSCRLQLQLTAALAHSTSLLQLAAATKTSPACQVTSLVC